VVVVVMVLLRVVLVLLVLPRLYHRGVAWGATFRPSCTAHGKSKLRCFPITVPMPSLLPPLTAVPGGACVLHRTRIEASKQTVRRRLALRACPPLFLPLFPPLLAAVLTARATTIDFLPRIITARCFSFTVHCATVAVTVTDLRFRGPRYHRRVPVNNIINRFMRE
jgi:hypothetical protein